MSGQDGDMGVWRPLPRILYGFAIFPFTPLEDESQPNPHQVPLEIGSELYVFEVFRPSKDTSYADEESLWYRGYVVASRQATSVTDSTGDANDTSDSSAQQIQPGAEEPSVTVGIFPATHCLIKERLEDTDARLEEVRQAADYALLEKGSGRKQRTPLAPLLEEDENSQDEDLLSGLVGNLQTPSKARNRASLVDGRLSGHKRSESSSSLVDNLAKTPVVDDRPSPPLPSLKTGDETAAGLDEPLIDEIACSLRGSASMLYTYLQHRDYANFNAVKESIEELHLGRRQLLGGTLSTDELQQLRKSLVDKLVQVNIQQGLDIVVRHPQWGALADVDAHEAVDERAWMSAVRMYKLGVELAYTDPKTGKRPLGAQSMLGPSTDFPHPSKRTRRSRRRSQSTSHTSTLPVFYHVLVDLKAFVASPCAPGETAELIFSLYNKSEKRFLTEECCIVVNHHGVPRDGRLDRARTLFKDLSQQDVLDTLVLVCRIIINGHLRTSPSTSNGRVSTATLNSPYSFQPPPSSASFVSPTLQSTVSFSDQQTSPAPRANRESMLSNPNDSRRSVRRPFGSAVVDISQLCKVGQTSAQYSELTMPIFVPLNEANFSTLHEDILASRIKEFEKSVKAEHVSVGLRFFHEDVKIIARDHPSLMHDTALTSRLGFPDVIMPDDQRNHIYVKLWTGDFPSLAGSGGKLRTGIQANIEVEIEVRDQDSCPVAGAISRGSGESHVTRFTSTVFRNSLSPTWGELLKVDLPPERMQDCHLFLTFRNRKERNAGSSISHMASGGSDKPFAFGYLPLFGADEACLSDGMHQLALYRYDPQWSTPATYFDVPSTVSGETEASQDIVNTKVLVPLRDSFSVRTFLCSTQLTQDPTLLKLLNWETSIPNNLQALRDEFNRLKYCPEFECIKMIRHVFDSIFAILGSTRNEHGDIDGPAVNVLVTLLSLVNDRRFEHFRPILDVYIEQHFTSSTAFSHIIRALQRLVENHDKAESAQDLRASIKVWSYLFKFIVRSRKMQRAKEEDMNVTANHLETAFKRDLRSLLQAINNMMAAVSPPSVIGTQGLAVQYFASIIPELLQCFSAEDMTDIVIEFCDTIVATKGAIIVHKILLQGHIVNGPLFENAGARAILVPNICRWLKPHLGKQDDMQAFNPRESEAGRDFSKVAWLESVRSSVAVVASLADKLHECLVDPMIAARPQMLAQEQDSIEYILSLLPRLTESYREAGTVETKQLLQRHRSGPTLIQKEPTVFPASHPAPLLVESYSSNAAQPQEPLISLHGEAATIIIVLIHLAPVDVLHNYLAGCLEVEGYTSFSRFLSSFLQTCLSLLRFEAFPSGWLNISMLTHKSIVKIAKPIATVMQQYLIPDKDDAAAFDIDLWKEFFGMLLKLLSSPSLVIEEFVPARQRAVWRLAGDIRGEGAQVLVNAWEALSWPDKASKGSSRLSPRVGGYQAGLGIMVGPVLELCLSHHDELRNSAVQILYTLLLTEFHLKGSFSAIENEVLDRLDKLFSQKKGDEISRAFFITQLRTLFEGGHMDDELRVHVDAFLESINHFLELLLGIRNLPESEEWQDDRVIGTLRLMAFIEKRHRAIFVRYVHRLVDFHIASGQLTEAGLTLKLHADLYSFDPATVAPPALELGFPEQSEFNRKELLYLRMLEYLGRGQAYETAIAISKELQQQYEQHVFAYQRLSELLMHQADLFASIVNRARQFPLHFRVGFFGLGFPISAQNKEYVYRAHDWEKFGSFCERMQSKHPQASLIRGHAVATPDMRNSDGRYLIITPVMPEPDKTNMLLSRPDIPSAIRSYYENNETRVFSYTRTSERVERTLVETASSLSSWTEKTYLYCAEAFPTILKRTEVVEVQVADISPLENALAEVQSKTLELETLEKRYRQLVSSGTTGRNGLQTDTSALSMALNSAVDTGLAGGIPLYRRAFFDSAFVTANADKTDTLNELRIAIDDQVRTIARCLLLHYQVCSPDMVTFHSTLIKFFERNFANELARMGTELEYQVPQDASPDLSVKHSPATGSGILGSSTSSVTKHQRNLSASTITSSNAHLPFALPPVGGIGDSTSVSPQLGASNGKSPFQLSTASYSSQALNVPLRSPPSKSTMRSERPHVNFALPNGAKDNGRLSPAPSSTPSTLANGTLDSNRPTSFLGRLASMRKKRF